MTDNHSRRAGVTSETLAYTGMQVGPAPQKLYRCEPIQSAAPNADTRQVVTPPGSGLGSRILSVGHHLVDGPLRDLHGLDPGRGAAVDGCLQHNLPDLDLGEAVVDGAARVQHKLEPCLLRDYYPQVCVAGPRHWLAGAHPLGTLAAHKERRLRVLSTGHWPVLGFFPPM